MCTARNPIAHYYVRNYVRRAHMQKLAYQSNRTLT